MISKHLGLAVAGAFALAATPAILAKTGAPHTLTGAGNFSEVTLTWKAPHDAKVLQWHNGRDYNGDDGIQVDNQKPISFYSGALFTADDLKLCVGETIESITFFVYQPVVSATVVVFENGRVVSQQKADPSKFAKNTWQTTALSVPVTIKADTDYRIAVRWEAGYNVQFTAIKDDSKAATGRGDQYSTDGVNWISTANGSYLITANLANDVDEEPVGYEVYCDDQNIKTVLGATSVVLPSQPAGTHLYKVHAIYSEVSHASGQLPVTVRPLEQSLPGVTIGTSSVNDLDVVFDWVAPLKGGSSLTWSDNTRALSIGGTASTNTKVWIRNEFSASDLIGFVGGKLSAINFNFAEDCVSGATVWVMRDGAFIQSQAVDAAKLSPLPSDGWVSVALDSPVEIEAGHSYAYGVYVLHTPKAHPISVGSSTTVNTKGNSFSTSSCNSTNFLKSSPSWKTLLSGGMEGNWMLSADIDGAPAQLGDVTYDVYRDGTLVKSGVAETGYAETVPDLGTYTYTVVTRDNSGRESDGIDCSLNVKLPAAYTAPVLETADFDPESRTISLGWTNDKELKKYDEITYVAGFDEEMTMSWGAQFTAADLAGYAGFSINKIRFIVGGEVKDLKVGVYTTKGVALSEESIPDGSIDPVAFYSINLSKPVAITGQEDLVLAYSGTIPAGETSIILDAGPLVTNGARVSLTGGLNWMNLGTINPAYNNYNIVIGALASEDAAAGAPARVVELGEAYDKQDLTSCVAKVEERAEPVEALAVGTAPAAKAPARAQARVASFNVYCNGELVTNTTQKTYTEKLTKFNEFKYYVTAVYANGWESAASASATVNNRIDQKAVAPYGLEATSYAPLTLSWQPAEAATVLSYVTGDTFQGLGMTGSGTMTSHVANRFSVEDLKDHVGKKIDHIQFALADTDISSAQVMVIIGENIVYTQQVPVSSLVVGINDVRLNEPFEIPAGVEVGAGYIVSYASGVKPLGMDYSEAVPNYGDLLSSSASPGYWYSLKTKFSMDRNFWIKTILAAPDVEVALATADQTACTYNVYCDGELLASGLKSTTYTVSDNIRKGTFHVTAVDATGVESGESNKVLYDGQSGVSDVTVDADAPVEYFNLQGVRIDNPQPGTTVIRRQGSNVTKYVVK